MADFVYEVACTGDRGFQDAVRTWSDAVAMPAWTALPGLSAVDAYVMATGGAHDPFVDDGAGPLLLAMLQFDTAEQMSRAIAGVAFARSLEGMPQGAAITGTPLERRLYPIGREATPGPLTAPFSYVVRYHRPADDEAEFVSHYLADHPPLLAKLPGIRSVLCYLPLDALATPALPTADIIIGNEVAFDSPEAFNAAMASPVRAELRAHFRTFPKFTGRNTHYPMMRRRLHPSTQRVAYG
jgi:uncharacterized protein (TIGR02118 family)